MPNASQCCHFPCRAIQLEVLAPCTGGERQRWHGANRRDGGEQHGCTLEMNEIEGHAGDKKTMAVNSVNQLKIVSRCKQRLIYINIQ